MEASDDWGCTDEVLMWCDLEISTNQHQCKPPETSWQALRLCMIGLCGQIP
jgi:hypothetical protein